jgi:SMC interacting uncharacterized protein involved in chromosome segregation
MRVRKHSKHNVNEKPVKDKYESPEDLDQGVNDDMDPEVHELNDDIDAIEAEEEEADRITFGMSFSPMDGDLGDETEDTGDLPETLLKNRYNQNLSTQPSVTPDDDELIEKMRITNENKAGLGYGDNDYSDKE